MNFFKKDPAMQKLKELTGGLLFTTSFEKKLKEAGLSVQDGYEIYQEIVENIKKGEVKEDGVETRINYLIEEKRISKQSKNIVLDDSTRIKLIFCIDKSEIDYASKDNLKKEVYAGKIKDIDTLNSRIDEIKEELYQKHLVKNKQQDESREPKETEDENQKVSEDTAQISSSKEDKDKSQGKSESSNSNGPQEKPKKGGDNKVNVMTPEKLAKMQKEDKIKEICFLLNQEHNLLKCPNCGVYFIKGDKFCYNCGFDILKFIEELRFNQVDPTKKESESKRDTDKKLEKEIKASSEDSKKESKSQCNASSESKQKPVLSASEKRAINLKFASVVYLNEIYKNPTKTVNANYYKSRYNTSLTKIKKQAKEDGYIVDGSPLNAARGAYVNDLKKILKKHGLMVSGTKDELIQRLGENLSEEELKKAFPKKNFAVTEKGFDFIGNNIYVLIYDQESQLRSRISVEEYDSLFADVKDLSEDNISEIIGKILNE